MAFGGEKRSHFMVRRHSFTIIYQALFMRQGYSPHGRQYSLSQSSEHLLTGISVPMDLSTTAAANPRAPGKRSSRESPPPLQPWGHVLYFQYLFNGTLQPVHVRFKQGEMRKKEVLEISLCLFLLA